MKEVHDSMRKTLAMSNEKIKQRVDEKKKDLKFQVGELAMVHLNKESLEKGTLHKLQIRRLGPCKILEKYGNNAYKFEFPIDIGLSHVFNVTNLVSYKGPIQYVDHNLQEVTQEVAD